MGVQFCRHSMPICPASLSLHDEGKSKFIQHSLLQQTISASTPTKTQRISPGNTPPVYKGEWAIGESTIPTRMDQRFRRIAVFHPYLYPLLPAGTWKMAGYSLSLPLKAMIGISHNSVRSCSSIRRMYLRYKLDYHWNVLPLWQSDNARQETVSDLYPWTLPN